MKGDAAQFQEYLHGRADVRGFLRRAGISRRNWDMFVRRWGCHDGHPWSYGDLANEYGISRPRALQITRRTLEIIQRFLGISLDAPTR